MPKKVAKKLKKHKILKVETRRTKKKQEDYEHIQFGPHLMIDAYNSDPKVIDDFYALYKFLDDLPKHLKMKKLTAPYVIKAEANGKKDPGGWTGTIIIAESHISFHSFAKRKFITIDIYSCKDFDVDKAIDYVKKLFKTDDVDIFLQRRGLRYPAHNLI